MQGLPGTGLGLRETCSLATYPVQWRPVHSAVTVSWPPPQVSAPLPPFHFLLSLSTSNTFLSDPPDFLVVAGYPGKRVTGPPSHHLLLTTSERVQDAMVTSTDHRRQELISTPNDHRLLLLPSATGGQHQQPQKSTFLGSYYSSYWPCLPPTM